MQRSLKCPSHAFPGTCQWLQDCEAFKKWIGSSAQSCGQLLWIKGKPGSGKSTLVRYIDTNILRNMPESLVVSFYFGDKVDGTRDGAPDLCASASGLYRAVCHQLLPHVRWDDYWLLIEALKEKSDSNERDNSCQRWSDIELQSWLSLVVECSRPDRGLTGKSSTTLSPRSTIYLPCEVCREQKKQVCRISQNTYARRRLLY